GSVIVESRHITTHLTVKSGPYLLPISVLV
ncbi:MAG: hypothetical protein ACI93H_000847, partial [Psychromonas sp.]